MNDFLAGFLVLLSFAIHDVIVQHGSIYRNDFRRYFLFSVGSREASILFS